MADYEFTLPWPPTVNHYHQPVRKGESVRIVKGKKAREYQVKSVDAIKELGLYDERLECDIELNIVLNPPTNARYDVDNRIKGVMDALTLAKFWLDDDQVVKLVVRKGSKTKGGNAEVKINKVTTVK